jgi:hypothetical protein
LDGFTVAGEAILGRFRARDAPNNDSPPNRKGNVMIQLNPKSTALILIDLVSPDEQQPRLTSRARSTNRRADPVK